MRNILALLTLTSLCSHIKCVTRDTSIRNEVRADIRLANKYYSLLINEDGTCHINKGKCTFFLDSMVVFSADTSAKFILKNHGRLFDQLRTYELHPLKLESRSGTAPRAEVYFLNKKVVDTYGWDSSYWELFKPILTDLPDSLNPFLLHAFDY